MKPKEPETPNGASPPPTSPTPGFFQRTSAALHPRAIFRLSNMSAFSRESRMWGVKPKQDHEVENQTKEEIGELMANDPNVKKMGEATGTTIRQAEEFPPDEDAVKANEARLAMWENKDKKKKRKKILTIVGVILIIGVIVAGIAVAVSGGDGDDNNEPPFRITELADQEKLCAAIKDPDVVAVDQRVLLYVSCQGDSGGSIFSCFSDGILSPSSNFCENVNGGVCGCDAGQIIDAATLSQGAPTLCVAQFNPNRELCSELEGDLGSLLPPPVAL